MTVIAVSMLSIPLTKFRFYNNVSYQSASYQLIGHRQEPSTSCMEHTYLEERRVYTTKTFQFPSCCHRPSRALISPSKIQTFLRTCKNTRVRMFCHIISLRKLTLRFQRRKKTANSSCFLKLFLFFSYFIYFI